MRKERRSFLPPVVQPVNVGDRQLGKFFLRDALQAPHVDAVHLSDWSRIANTEGTHATVLAEEVLIRLCVEEVFGHFVPPRQQAKTFWLRNRYPKPISPANRAVAPVRARRKVEINLKPHRSAVATPTIGLQHAFALA
jgi:hypothetical protein